MASKHITASRSLLFSSSSSPSTSFSSDLIEHSTTTFQKSPLYVLEEQQGYRTTLEYIQQRVLRDKFTSFMFPPFLVSIAGALMKPKSAHLGLYKAKLNSDVVVLSTGGPSNSRGISAVRFVPGSQLSLLWRTPWTYATFGRSYGSAAESRKREVRVSDEVDDDNDGDAGEPSEFEDDDDVEDEQLTGDSDDAEEEEDQEPQSQGPPKKKVQTKPAKSKFPDQRGRLLNEKITARIIRLVNDDNTSHTIVSRDEALTLAKRKKLDLVLVDINADPPVCKIFDFNREEYKKEQIMKDRKKKKGTMVHFGEVKELRFNSKTEPKDLKMKVEKAKEFMTRGYRVKFVANFKGKFDDEKKRLEDEKMIDAIYPMVEDFAVIEQGPRVESRQAWVMIRHVKFGSKKKPPKREANIGATDQVEIAKHEDQVYSEPDFYQGQEENVMYAQNASSVSETVPLRGLQGYPSKVAAPPTQPYTFRSPYEAGHSQVQPPPLQGTVEGFSSKVHSPPLHGFPQSLQGFGGSQGSERPASPLPGPLPSIPTLQRSGVQGTKFQISPPGVSPLPASSLQGFEGARLQKLPSSPLDGMLPPQSEQRPSHTPKIQTFSMPSQSRGQEENVMYAQNASSVSETVPMRRLQGYPSKAAAPPTQPFTFQSPYEAGHSQVQPPPLQGTVEGFSSKVHSPPLHGFPQSLQGFGSSQGSERPASPPPGPLPSIPTLQRAGVQGAKIQISPPGVSPLPASSLQGFEGAQLQKLPSSPLDGMLPPQSEQRPFHTPKIQKFSMPSQSRGTLSQKQSPNDAPRPEKAIGSEVTQGVYPATSRGRGISPPNQQPHSLFSSTPPTSLRGPPPNLRGSLLNLSQAPPTPVTHMRGPLNLQESLLNVLPSTSAPSSHEGGSSDVESPLIDFFSSPPRPTRQRAASSLQGSHPDPSSFVPAQNVQERYSQPQQNQAPQGYPPQQNQAPQGYPLQGSHPDPSPFVPAQNVQERYSPPQQNQAPQGYPPQQNQQPRGYPPQRGFAQTGYPPQRGSVHAQGAFGFQGNYPQNQGSQGSPPPSRLPQTRPVVPSPGFRPSWSTPPQSQEYSPLFESPSDKP